MTLGSWQTDNNANLRKFSVTTSRSQKLILKADLKWECPYFYSKFFCLRVLVNMKLITDQVSQKRIEEVSIKSIDRQIAKKKELPLKLIKFYWICFTGNRICYYFWYISVAFPYFLHFSVHPFQRHVLFPFLWHLVCPSVSQALPLLTQRCHVGLPILIEFITVRPIYRYILSVWNWSVSWFIFALV